MRRREATEDGVALLTDESDSLSMECAEGASLPGVDQATTQMSDAMLTSANEERNLRPCPRTATMVKRASVPT